MPIPRSCRLWHDPEGTLARPMEEVFELVEEICDSPHMWRHILRCRDCGQPDFLEFLEEIEWEAGNDPSWVTYVPCAGDEDLERLKRTAPPELRAFRPHLAKDFPADAERPTVAWVFGPDAPEQVH